MRDLSMVVGAALSGVAAGVQSLGPWAGRRQLFVRFAGEAETARMYIATALVRELARQQSHSTFHSIVIGGRDVLGNVPFLFAALSQLTPTIPVMLDTDGQRPAELVALRPFLALTQVTVELGAGDASVDNAMRTVGVAAEAGGAHALVIVAQSDTPDSQILRLVQDVHRTSALTQVVLHPFQDAEMPGALDRRWATVLELATATHGDVRLCLRIPPPTGLR